MQLTQTPCIGLGTLRSSGQTPAASALLSSAGKRNLVVEPAKPVTSSPRIRLEVLDALRGLAALVVVFFHVRVIVDPISENLSRPFHILATLTNHGHDAVVVFIVLSGFVLTLPIARGAFTGGSVFQMPGGLKEYFRRRARRILPPYFAALVIFLLLGVTWCWAADATGQRKLSIADNPYLSATDATPAALLAHALMIFNVRRSWALSVDSPMWSVATEWQIYFLFPLVLLPLWRRAGLPAAVVGGFAVGLIPVLMLPRGTDFQTWCPWMLGDFALGLAAAAIAFAPTKTALSGGLRIWGIGCAAVIALLLLVQFGMPRVWHVLSDWEKDALVGGAVALLLIYLSRCQMTCVQPPVIFRALDTRVAIALGGFSYSLYLVHYPILSALSLILDRYASSAKMYVICMYVFGPIVSLVFGYVFHLAFERPFMRSKARASLVQA